jgi:hypothetical protein
MLVILVSLKFLAAGVQANWNWAVLEIFVWARVGSPLAWKMPLRMVP